MTTLAGFRLANWDTPLWASPNRRASRFGVPGRVVQYWALHPLTCWAEHLRYHDVRTADEASELLARPWTAQLTLPDSTLVVTFDSASSAGIAAEALVDDDWAACQDWAQTLDVPAIVVPSAALPGTENVVVFGAKVRARYGTTPVDPVIDIPTDPVANTAEVVTTLLPHVRWRGTPHAGLDAWHAGMADPLPPAVSVQRSP